MKLKVLYLLNCESSKYIAKLFSLSIFNLLPTNLRISFSKFRCTNHKLPIEKGRFLGIARDDRICNLRNSAKLGDEYHYIIGCDYLKKRGKNSFLRNTIRNTTLKTP